MAYGGISRFSENGLALPARPSSSQKKKEKTGTFIRKSITISRRKRKQASPGEEKMRSLLHSYRVELRPLLDAIRFVESSNRADCPDGDGGASIGPLQISEHYHLDAWKNGRTYSWLRCRELEHAENTVVAYWMRYCSDALSRNDWEILAKIHNGGPQGPQREKTAYYWSKVAKHLEQMQAPPPVLKSGYQKSNAIAPRSLSRCSSFTNLDRKIDCKLKHGLKVSAAERQKPIVSKHRKHGRAPLTDISSTLNVHYSELRLKASSSEDPRRIHDLNIQHLGLEYTYLSSDVDGVKGGKLVDNVQCNEELGDCGGNMQSGSPIDGIVERRSLSSDEVEHRTSEDYWRSPESFGPNSLDMLYSSELSEQKEEEIFTELARLLPLDLSNSDRVCESFEFPRAAIETEYATPVLNKRVVSFINLDLSRSALFKEDVSSLVDDGQQSQERFTSTGLSDSTPDQQSQRAFGSDQSATVDSGPKTTESDQSDSTTNNEKPLLFPLKEKDLLSELADVLHLPQPVSSTTEQKEAEDGIMVQIEGRRMREKKVEDDVIVIEKADNQNEPLVGTIAKFSDFLLEIPDPSASVEYVKALFSCEDVLLEKLCKAPEPREKEVCVSAGTAESRTGRSFSACTCHTGSENRVSSSLKRLCAVWDEQDVDLLTRSLRFKMLTENKTKDMPCLAWEIQALQNMQKNAKSRKAAKDVIQQQRDMIYVNIGAYATRSERYQLYATWGVRKLPSGRLKKLVYELLWRDPKRYYESAALVTLYL